MVNEKGMSVIATWQNLLDAHCNVELSSEHVTSNNSVGYQLDVESITGHSSLSNPAVHHVEYHIRLSLFDAAYRRFVGHTWRSKTVATTRSELVTQPQRINFKQPVYFHTPILDSSIMVVIELVTTLTPKDPLPGQEVQGKSHSAGWSLMRLFSSDQPLHEVGGTQKNAVKKLDLFQGSPRALLYLQEPVESNPNILLVPGCQAFVRFSRHSALHTVAHLIPEHVIVACDRRIPGVSDQHSVVGDVKDYYLKPKIIKPKTCYVDHLRIELGLPLEKFEAELCAKVNDDRLQQSEIPDDGKRVTVAARGLRVGVHNGYCYVQKPQFFHVEPEALIGGLRMSDQASKREPSSEALVLRSRLELAEMMFDPGMAVCFELEYTLSLPTPGHAPVHGSRTSMFHQSQTVMVRWAWWAPSKKDQTVSVCLIGYGTANPGRQLFYKPDPEEVAELGCIRFDFLTTDVTVIRSEEFRSLEHKMKATSSPRKGLPKKISDDEVDEDHVDMSQAQKSSLVAQSSFLAQKSSLMQKPSAIPIDKLSRAMHARFCAEIPDIIDRKGNPSVAIDPTDVGFKVDFEKNVTDTMQTNEIVLQFLAYAPPHPGPQEKAPPTVNSLFFSFHFYRFEALATQRVALTKRIVAPGCHDNYAPRLLQKIEPGERIDEGPAGLEVKFRVDPADLDPGESSGFLSYLMTHKLHIDVWDGESLMLLGSVAVPLQHLLRNRHCAVSALHELDVVLLEHADVASTFTGDLHGRGRVRPLGLKALHRGKLFLRMGNVGYPSQCETPAKWKLSPLVVADLSGNSFTGGSVSSKNVVEHPPGCCKVAKLASLDVELAELLVLNDDAASNKENNKAIDAERKRKLTRMKFVRSAERDDATRIRIGQKALLERQERALKERDLRTVASYRERTKDERIMRVLTLAITTQHTIRPPVGVAEFVELQLRNPFRTPQTITIDCDVPELRVVTDFREWRHFKERSGLHTPVEEDMFGFDAKSSLPQVYMQAKETVHIPFRYQTFEADHRVAVQGPSHFHATPTSIQPIRNACVSPDQSKVAKAIIRTSDGRPLSILQLNVHPQPPTVDQTLRFYNPEQSFFKKCIRLPPFDPACRDHDEFHAVCTDTEVVCQAKLSSPDSPREIYLKAPCGESPSIRKFYLCIYTDPFLMSPIQTWQFFVHSLQRMDVNCVLGETSRFTMAIRGTKCVRKVRCFPSHPSDMQVSPECSFILPANGVSEVSVGVRAVSPLPQTRFMYVHVVDVEFHQLVRCWLVVVKTREPIISKEFTIELPLAGSRANNKMISYTNPYPHSKKFALMTSRADLLHFRDTVLELQGGEKSTIGLRFVPGVTKCGKYPIHIFINNEEDRNEETFLINVVYY